MINLFKEVVGFWTTFLETSEKKLSVLSHFGCKGKTKNGYFGLILIKK